MTGAATPAPTVRAQTSATILAAPDRPVGAAVSASIGDAVVPFPCRLDVHSAHAYREQLLEVLRERPTRLAVDLSDVGDLDGVAGALLVGIQRRLAQTGGELLLVNVPAGADAALRRLGLSRFFSQAPREKAPTPCRTVSSRQPTEAPACRS